MERFLSGENMKKCKKCILIALVCMLITVSGCGSGQKGDKSLNEAENYLQENKENMRMYELLNSDVANLFDDYTGGSEEIFHYDSAGRGVIDSTCLTDDVYYWRDDSGNATAQDAAKELMRIMLEGMNGDGYTFTVTKYSIGEQTLLSWESLPAALAADTSGDVETLLKQDKENYDVPLSWWEYGIAISDNMWLLDPQFTFDYEGIANMYRRDEAESAGLLAENGMVNELQQGSADAFVHIIVKNGNVWRMQRAGALESMFS
jgi:hypothetical protein